MAAAKRLRSEFVVAVSGTVQRRSDDTINTKIATGEVEVLAREIRVLSEAKTPPFSIADDAQVSEESGSATGTSTCGARACSRTSACATA